MRAAYDICQPSGELSDEETAIGQCFMAIAGFVRKMSGTGEVDAETMNRSVEKMVEAALKFNKVESVFQDGEKEDVFDPEIFEKQSDIKMASKLELLVNLLSKNIKNYEKANRVVAKKFRDKLEDTVRRYNERRSKLFAEEEFKREQTSEEIVKDTTAQALQIFKDLNSDRESFRRMGLSFEEKTYYDILTAVCD